MFFYQLMSRLEQSGVDKRYLLYVNFEDERLEFDEGLDQILDAWQELYPELDPGKLYLFYDEIQELAGWEKYVRRVYDRISRRIFLTGSNAKMLSQEIATALRGRSISFEVFPLSFKEYLDFSGTAIGFSSRDIARIRNLFEDYLVWGVSGTGWHGAALQADCAAGIF